MRVVRGVDDIFEVCGADFSDEFVEVFRVYPRWRYDKCERRREFRRFALFVEASWRGLVGEAVWQGDLPKIGLVD